MAPEVYTPVIIIRLDIEGDPLRVWSGPGVFAPSGTGDAALDGLTFEPIEGLYSITDAVENADSGAPMTITARADDLDEPVLRQVIRDLRRWQGKPAYVWLAFLNGDDVTVSASPGPVRVKTGVMADIELNDGAEGGLASLSIDMDAGDAVGREMRVQDHSRLWPDAEDPDTFGNYVQKLVNQPQGVSGAAPVRAGGGGSIESNKGFTWARR